MIHRLVLWDIDGTLVSCGPPGREALEGGARLAAGLCEVPHITMGGKTDPQIISEILRLAGLPGGGLDELMPAALGETRRLLASWRERITAEGKVHPGVREVLEALAEVPGVRQTLVTGNLAANAEVKVSAFGLERYLDLHSGAYADDNPDRDRLVPIALRRVRELWGDPYEPGEAWVIGDTARDLSCARAAGARCLLVGTGQGGFTAIRDLPADAVLEDLSDTRRVLDILLDAQAGIPPTEADGRRGRLPSAGVR